MRYRKIVAVDEQVLSLLMSGHLKLQCGQWIQLDWCSKPSRWVGRRPSGSVWAVHYSGKSVPLAKFQKMAKRYKEGAT